MLKSMKRFDTWLNEYRLETDKRTDKTVKEGLGDLRSTVTGKLGGKRTGSDMEMDLRSEGGGGGAGFTTAPP